MEFLNSFFWYFIPLISVPWIIHFLNKRFPTTVPFPDINLIVQVFAGRKRWIRWRDLFFLLARILILLMLLFVFLQPVWNPFKKPDQKKQDRKVALLIDHSMSMEYRGEALSPYQRAVSEASKILKTLGGKDEATVIMVEEQAKPCFPELSSDIEELQDYIEKTEPAYGTGDINQSFRFLQNLKKPVNEVYILSDFQRSQWSTMDLGLLDPSVSIFFIDVATDLGLNRSIQKVELVNHPIMPDNEVRLKFEVLNAHSQKYDGMVECMLGNRMLKNMHIEVDAWSSAEREIILSPLPVGDHALSLRIPDDDLAADNQFHFSLSVRNKEEVALISDKKNGRGWFYLLKAMNPYQQLEGSILPKELSSKQWSRLQHSGIDKAFLCGSSTMDPSDIKSCSRFIEQGGRLVYFLDGENDATNIHQLASQLNTDPPINIGAKLTAENLNGGVQKWSWADFNSPFLTMFRDEYRSLLSQVEVYQYHQTTASQDVDILMRYQDQTPAVIQWEVGAGMVLFLNFSVDELSSNLPRQNLFPAWIHDILKQLKPESANTLAHEVGKEWRDTLWKDDAKSIRMKNPQGKSVTMALHWGEEKVALSFRPKVPGIYQLKLPNKSTPFAANPPSVENDLRPINKDILKNRLVADKDVHFVQGMNDYSKIAKGEPLMELFFWAMLAWIVVESIGLFLWRRKTI